MTGVLATTDPALLQLLQLHIMLVRGQEFLKNGEEPRTATIALLGLQELSRQSDASTLPYGALAAPAKLPRGALATAKLVQEQFSLHAKRVEFFYYVHRFYN